MLECKKSITQRYHFIFCNRSNLYSKLFVKKLIRRSIFFKIFNQCSRSLCIIELLMARGLINVGRSNAIRGRPSVLQSAKILYLRNINIIIAKYNYGQYSVLM